MKVDLSRWKDRELWEQFYGCGVYVGAETPKGWEAVDICLLDRPSLEEWLQKLDKALLTRLVLRLVGYESHEEVTG